MPDTVCNMVSNFPSHKEVICLILHVCNRLLDKVNIYLKVCASNYTVSSIILWLFCTESFMYMYMNVLELEKH